ncbi:MAG: hypothetical protein HY996_00710 [Micrococcales bacterium]|nr:hypothetical protein [Micrococcales bacterium]
MTTRDDHLTEKDMSYSPASESETAVRQSETADPDVDDVDRDAVRVAPGEGGPDDAGDIDLEGVELHVPGREPVDG